MTHGPRSFVALCVFAGLLFLAPSSAVAQCKAINPSVPIVAMSAVIAQGGYLSSDGKGAYVDGTQGSVVSLGDASGSGAANFLTGQDAPLTPKSRFIGFNFNSPYNDPNPIVPDAVYALPLGIISDRQAEVHVHYYLGPVEADGLRQIHSIQELPDDGLFRMSDRTGLRVQIDGVPHRVFFGGDTWPVSFCRPDEGLVFAVAGTTKLQIARQDNTYTVQAPPGSIGRLYNFTDPFAPIDKGLYRFSFVITFAPVTKKGNK